MLQDRLAAARRDRTPLVMGILNVTPDSFSDGGRFDSVDRALVQARRMADEGADLLDVGGESTRPGAAPVGLEAELARVIPAIKQIISVIKIPISIDTTKPEVMRAAVATGAAMINDVNGLRAPGAVEAVAELKVPACIMHMQGEPRTMQESPTYDDVVGDIRAFFVQRLDDCRAAGIVEGNIVLDPGFGFGKTLDHNLELLARLGEFRALGCPLVAGISRKSVLGAITGRQRPEERLAASLAAAVLAAEAGADVIRVHDVAETVDALAVWAKVRDCR